MAVLRLGLTIAALGFLIATIGSVRAGYPLEIALVRGLLSFMALSFVAYLGELIVVTVPPVNAEAPRRDRGEGTDGGEIVSADDKDEGPTHRPDEPARLPEPTDEREAA